jgi:hypothetical protein
LIFDLSIELLVLRLLSSAFVFQLKWGLVFQPPFCENCLVYLCCLFCVSLLSYFFVISLNVFLVLSFLF